MGSIGECDGIWCAHWKTEFGHYSSGQSHSALHKEETMTTGMRKQIQSQSGQLTLDFLFATVLIMSTAGLVSVLCIGLTLAEVLQYVTFSGSRAYFAADKTKKNQVDAAEAQVQSLLGNLPFLNGALKNNWISVKVNGPNNYLSPYAENKGATTTQYPDKTQYVGYQLEVKFALLTFKFPIFGDLVQPPNGSDFHATLSSFIMREPSMSECQELMKLVYDSVKKNYSQVPPLKGEFVPIMDNGC